MKALLSLCLALGHPFGKDVENSAGKTELRYTGIIAMTIVISAGLIRF